MFVDSHCHLEMHEQSVDTDALVERARKAGVGRLVTVSTSRKEFEPILALTRRYADVYGTIGIHPEEIGKEGEAISEEALVAYAEEPKVVGFGETGLDYYYDNAPPAVQEEGFRQHIRASIRTGLPLIIHTREAEDDTIRILEEERRGKEEKLRGVFHCFSSHRRLAEYGLKIGFYISFSGILTFKKSGELREIAKDVPLNRILVETDSPFLAPEPFRGKPCEPAFVVHTARKLAEVKNVTEQQIETITTENFFTLFSKVVRP